jgi:outer membrane usher protein
MNASWVRRAGVATLAVAIIWTGSSPANPDEIASNAPVIAETAERTFATIIVNGEQSGEQVVLVKPDGVYASLSELRARGLVIPPRFDEGDAARYVNVNDLAPEITARFDVNGPTLRLDAASAASLTRVSVVSLAPDLEQTRDATAARSGFLNYSLRAGSAGLSGAQELTLSDEHKTFFSAGTFDAHGFHRSLTNLTWTNALARRRSMVGDIVADSGDLGSALTITGASISRAADIDPDGRPHPSPILRATVLTPSTADIFVNGQLIRTVDVAPGTVDFSNLPGTGGVTDAIVVLRDAFGRTQAVSTRYYGASSVMNKGETDYAFAAGAARETLATRLPFGNLVALARYRLGLTESTTVGAHAELAGGFENAGASVAHAGRIGTWEMGLAQSRDRGASGLAGSLAYAVGTRNIWLNAAVRAATRAYTTIGERPFSDRIMSDQRASIGMRPFRGTYMSAISYSASRSLLGVTSRLLSWQQSVALPGGVSLLVTAGTSATNGASHRDFSVFLFRSAPRSSSLPTVNASLQSDGSGVRKGLELQRTALPSGGTGYDVTGYDSGPTVANGRLAARSPIGNIDVDYALARGGPFAGNIAVSGAVAFAGQYAHLSQPIADSFAIVNVVGGERVKVLVGNQDAGTTDRHGVLVIANLPSYSAQRIRIERDDGPVNLGLSNADRNIMVASGHGGVARFSAAVVTAVIGTVSVSGIGGTVIPAFGQLSLLVGGKSVTSELDRDGHFYLEDVPPGSHAAVIRYGGGECRFSIEIPRSTGIETNVGAFTCART